MGELNIVPVEHPHQVQRVAVLAKEIWTEHYTPIIGADQVAYMLDKFQSAEAVTAQIKDGYLYYLMEVDGVAAGYASIKPEGETMFLSKIYVHQTFRQQKIAARTLSYLEETAREHGCRSMYLTVNKNNRGSIAAYEKMGFQKSRTQKSDIGGGFFIDDDVMEKAVVSAVGWHGPHGKAVVFILIQTAEERDLREILDLQYLAYQSEAKRFSDPNIPPLIQTMQSLQMDHRNGTILKATGETGAIIGSVRAYLESGTAYLGKLMVHPLWQGNGVGTKLLSAIEQTCPAQRYELFTSTRSEGNIRLYERLGYRIFKKQTVTDELQLVYLEKYAAQGRG